MGICVTVRLLILRLDRSDDHRRFQGSNNAFRRLSVAMCNANANIIHGGMQRLARFSGVTVWYGNAPPLDAM